MRIGIGLTVGVCVGVCLNILCNSDFATSNEVLSEAVIPSFNVIFKIIGNLFVGALKAIAPVLIFFLISSSIMNAKKSYSGVVKYTFVLYIFGTFCAALIAVLISNIFEPTLVLSPDIDTSQSNATSNMSDIIVNIFNSVVANPIDAIAQSKFLGVLFWSLLFGIVAKPIASSKIKNGFVNMSDIFTRIVKVIIELAPFGICGLVYTAIVESGFGIAKDYGLLLGSYLTCAFVLFFVFNPLIVFLVLKKNPYPLVLRSIIDVGFSAFFLRSSAANIPVNMEFCKRLHLDKDSYTITISLGSTINMEGAAITIITLTLACCRTLGIHIDFAPALVLSMIACISAIGASGVSGGSILLIPLACSVFGISPEISSAVVAVGFIIGVIQDSVETALNSSTDGLFTATVQLRHQIKSGKPYHKIVGGSLEDAK